LLSKYGSLWRSTGNCGGVGAKAKVEIDAESLARARRGKLARAARAMEKSWFMVLPAKWGWSIEAGWLDGFKSWRAVEELLKLWPNLENFAGI
jgi:hypothetical protein